MQYWGVTRKMIRFLSLNLSSIILITAPMIASPLMIVWDSKAARCGWLVIVMALYWMFEVVPLPITSLMPVFLMPMLGILDSGTVTKMYMKETAMMFLGGLMLALSVENCHLHRRVALKTLLVLGSSTRWLIIGFMLPTAFLSMWMSNTSTTAMMLPIIDAILGELRKCRYAKLEEKLAGVVTPCALDLKGDTTEQKNADTEGETDDDEFKKIRVTMMLAVAFSANIGGTGSLAGTGPNLILKGIVDGHENTELNFASWMLFAVPLCIVCIIFAWLWLQIYFFGFRKTFSCDKYNENDKVISQVLKRSYEHMGSMTCHEISVAVLFSVTVVLWVFRDPGFITGWKSLFPDTLVGDSAPVFLILFVMFALPAKTSPTCVDVHLNTSKGQKVERIHSWPLIHSRVPWGTYILIGSGFALSEGVKVSGLSGLISQQMAVLKILPLNVIVLITSGAIAMVTEITSNTATATIALPVLLNMAVAIQVHPLYLLIPATLSCSFAFMLPVATPSNSLVYAACGMKMKDMIKAGIVMNVVCIALLNLFINTLGVTIYNLDTFPAWALHLTNTTAS